MGCVQCIDSALWGVRITGEEEPDAVEKFHNHGDEGSYAIEGAISEKEIISWNYCSRASRCAICGLFDCLFCPMIIDANGRRYIICTLA